MISLLSCVALAIPSGTISLVPMEKGPYTLVEVDLGAYGKTKMIVDTGASETVLAQWLVEDAKIPVSASAEKGTDSGGAQFQASQAQVRSYAVGSKAVTVPFLYVVPAPPQFKQFGIGGILSPQSVFSGTDVLIDPARIQILLGAEASAAVANKKPAATLAIRPCSKEMDNKYVVSASLNGVAGSFYLDTGGRRSAATAAFGARLGRIAGQKDERSGAASTRTVERLSGITLKLDLMETTIDLDLEPGGVSCPTADGKIGNDILKQYAILLPAARNEVRLFK
jgi:hypothetical protein